MAQKMEIHFLRQIYLYTIRLSSCWLKSIEPYTRSCLHLQSRELVPQEFPRLTGVKSSAKGFLKIKRNCLNRNKFCGERVTGQSYL